MDFIIYKAFVFDFILDFFADYFWWILGAIVVIIIYLCTRSRGKGNDLSQNDMTSEEEKALIQDAHNGDANAQCIVGLMYMTGKKSAFNSKSKAEKYLLASAMQGYVMAQVAVGDLYFIEEYGTVEQALFWYSCAYMQGDDGAMERLNDMMRMGLPGGREHIEKICQNIQKNYRQYIPKVRT